jgi:maltose-binding protein MalE
MAVEPTASSQPTPVTSPNGSTSVPTIAPSGATTAAICPGGGSGGTLNGDLTIWYAPNAAEQATMENVLVNTVCPANPALKLTLKADDPAHLVDDYVKAAADGSPDVLYGSNQALPQLVDKGVAANLKADVDASSFTSTALSGATYTPKKGDAGVWLVPQSIDGVVLFYTSASAPAPATTDDLMTGVTNGTTKIGLLGGETSAMDSVAWYGAFGAKLVDDNGKCVADTTGAANALAYLQDLQGAGALFYPDRTNLSDDFESSALGMVVDTTEDAAAHQRAMNNLSAGPLPAGSAGPASPWLSVKGYYVNPKSANEDLAVAFAKRMVEPDVQQQFMNDAVDVPATSDAPVASGLGAQLAAALQTGFVPSPSPNLANFYAPFGTLMLQLLGEGADPASGVQDACTAMNQANGF